MAITNDEWKKLAKLLDERLDIKLEEKLEGKLSKKFSEFEVRFERKLEEKFDSKLEGLEGRFDKKLKTFGEDIITDITNYIDESIIPLINEKADKTDVDRMERKLDRAIDRLYGHEDRISEIESVPVVAHHLSIKKTRKKTSD